MRWPGGLEETSLTMDLFSCKVQVWLLLLFSGCAGLETVAAVSNIEPPHALAQGDGEPMSVLLVPRSGSSHLIQMFALGDALARRGHNVTLCSTVREGNDLPQRLSKATGVTLLSAGPDPLQTVRDYLDFHAKVQSRSVFHSMRTVVLPQTHDCARRLGNKLTSNSSYASMWDIIVADHMHAVYFACLSMKWSVPFISLRTSLDYLNLPHWPYPIYGSAYTDDLTFFQRFELVFSKSIYKILFWSSRRALFESAREDFKCSNDEYHSVYHIAEGYSPVIVSTSIGFEYPRPLLPMVHYVGPLLLKSDKKLSSGLVEWLGSKTQKSVIYISMGSGAYLTLDVGNALINGLLQTNYSVVWSLRESNRDILEGFSLSRETFYISNWLPQQTILKNKAIAMAVVHGGMAGIAEAIHNKVPMIVMPFALDQFDNAARVQHSGAGVHLDGSTLTSDELQTAIATVSSVAFKKAAEKLHKIFLHAGGVDKAAELVEFYNDVGYGHLVSAYFKYKWSWVRYYNVDVYGLSSILAVVLVLAVFKSCALCCRCSKKTKTE